MRRKEGRRDREGKKGKGREWRKKSRMGRRRKCHYELCVVDVETLRER